MRGGRTKGKDSKGQRQGSKPQELLLAPTEDEPEATVPESRRIGVVPAKQPASATVPNIEHAGIAVRIGNGLRDHDQPLAEGLITVGLAELGPGIFGAGVEAPFGRETDGFLEFTTVRTAQVGVGDDFQLNLLFLPGQPELLAFEEFLGPRRNLGAARSDRGTKVGYRLIGAKLEGAPGGETHDQHSFLKFLSHLSGTMPGL